MTRDNRDTRMVADETIAIVKLELDARPLGERIGRRIADPNRVTGNPKDLNDEDAARHTQVALAAHLERRL